MKVLVFTSLYPNNIWPSHGVFVKERMTHFAMLDGCSVKVVAPVPYYPRFGFGWRCQYARVASREVREGLEVYHPRYFMSPKLGMVFYGLMMCLSVLPLVKKIRREFDFDLVDAHYVYPDGFAAVLLGRILNKPVVVSARGSDINLYGGFPIIRKLLRYSLHKADKVIAVCQALKDAMITLGIPDEKICVIPNGVDVKKFYRFPKEEAKRRLNLPMDKRVILSVGGLIPRKGFDLVIKGLKILCEELHEKNVYLVIVGDGPSRGALGQLVSSLGLREYVRLVGPVPHEELYLWYSAADVFCLASSREGWPNVLLESLACGTPVVAADIWGVPEVIRSDRVGLLTMRSERAIADGIVLALKKTWRSQDLLEYARVHTWDQVARGVFHVFESIVGRRSLCCKDSADATEDNYASTEKQTLREIGEAPSGEPIIQMQKGHSSI